MFTVLPRLRKLLRPVAALAIGGILAACDASIVPSGGGINSGGPTLARDEAVPVALLIPSSDAGAATVARSLENAARLAIKELDGVEIDLRVYDTAGQAAQASALGAKGSG